jgi:hypothetical protein
MARKNYKRLTPSGVRRLGRRPTRDPHVDFLNPIAVRLESLWACV